MDDSKGSAASNWPAPIKAAYEDAVSVLSQVDVLQLLAYSLDDAGRAKGRDGKMVIGNNENLSAVADARNTLAARCKAARRSFNAVERQLRAAALGDDCAHEEVKGIGELVLELFEYVEDSSGQRTVVLVNDRVSREHWPDYRKRLLALPVDSQSFHKRLQGEVARAAERWDGRLEIKAAKAAMNRGTEHKHPQRVEAEYQADPKTEARDKWIYDEWQKGTPVPKIIGELRANAWGWGRITSHGGIRKAAERYAERNGLPAPSNRKPGRLKEKPVRPKR